MKRFNVLPVILLCVSILTLTACQSTQTNSPSDPSSAQSTVSEDPGGESSKLPDEDVSSAGSNTEQKDLPEYQPGSIQLVPQEQDEYEFERKYRITYYRIWGEFTECLSEEQKQDYTEWVENYSKQNEYGKKQNEMQLASYLKRYQIPREEFDKAAEKFIANGKAAGWDTTQEEYEVPNGDIIYTFDNEIINQYYRYE